MKQFSLYDILGVIAPGAVFTIGVVALYPDAVKVIPSKEFSLGDFGIVLIVSYIMGNLVAALGNLLEKPYWQVMGGRHSEVARSEQARVLSSRQKSALERRIKAVGFLTEEEKLTDLRDTDWRAMARQIYAFLSARHLTQRIDVFNAQYGLNRGIAAAFLALCALITIHSGFVLWRAQLILLIFTALAAYRMHRFSQYYAAELFRQFIVSPESAPPAESAKVDKED